MTEQKRQTHQTRKEELNLFGKLLLFGITILAILLMFSIFYYLEDWRDEHFPQKEKEPEQIISSGMLACVEMGCPVGTKFIGAKSGATYHDCSSSLARSIKIENRVCFSSATDAVAQGYST